MGLTVENVTSGYGSAIVIENISMSVDSGDVLAVIGPNGAGKSTLLRTIAGIVEARSGTIELGGTDLTGIETEELIQEGVVYVPQEQPIFSDLTVIDNLRMSGWRLDGNFEDRVEDVYEQFPILEDRSNQVAGTLSGGQRQMLAVAPAIMYDADFLMLDEPSAGLAPQLVTEMFDHILDIIGDDTGVLLVEQNAEEALRVANRAMILEGGSIQTEATAEELKDSEEIAEIYMGE
jgi:ABC-type branched-subunit amino acid transport system ATPase component